MHSLAIKFVLFEIEGYFLRQQKTNFLDLGLAAHDFNRFILNVSVRRSYLGDTRNQAHQGDICDN